MTFIPLKIQPGVFKNGTKYQAKGRWFDSDLIRWFGGSRAETALQAIGGWAQLKDSSDANVAVTQPPRAMFGWRDNDGIAHLAIGSFCKAWAFVTGTLTEITPSGITCGTEDAEVTNGGAYGEGDYGDGPYGGVVSDTRNQIIEAGTWTFDNFGEVLLGCPFPDSAIYSWDTNPANDFVAVAGAPTANAVVVTPERFVVALAAGGDRRKVQWADQESLTTWTPDGTNQAGDFLLSGPGEILFGLRAKAETLIWTDTDLWAMRYIAGDFIYRFDNVGAGAGGISRHCGVIVGGSRAIWMGKRGFFVYDGVTRDLPCEVADYVFNDINWIQVSKVHAVPVNEFGEVMWFYPSANSTENDRYVKYNWRLNTWDVGTLSRTAGIDAGPHQFPLMADAEGKLYEHERGTSYLNPAGVAMTPYAESGPVEIGNGDQVMCVQYLVPDDKTLGDVDATLYTSFHPDGAEDGFGPFTLSEQTSVRRTGRWVRLRLRQVNPGWRVGVPRLDVVPGGRR